MFNKEREVDGTFMIFYIEYTSREYIYYKYTSYTKYLIFNMIVDINLYSIK